jgi:predicted extracellular nuclease
MKGRIALINCSFMFFLIIALLVGWKHGFATLTELVPICIIQGRDFSSPYAGNSIRTRGIVHTDLDETWKRGFFMQDEDCDEDPATSDGIYVYLGVKVDDVDSGDYVEVSGTVQEYYGLTELSTSPEDAVVLSTGNPLPAALDLTPPYNNDASRVYFESVVGDVCKSGSSVNCRTYKLFPPIQILVVAGTFRPGN